MKLKKTRQLINNFRSQDTTFFGEEERSSDREEYMRRASGVQVCPISYMNGWWYHDVFTS